MDTTYKLSYISTFHADVAQVVAALDESPRKAARIFFKLDKILANLVLLPEMFPVYEDFPIFRKIVIEDYIVFYTFDRLSGLVEVHRLLYGGMDLPVELEK
ncbi:MAG: type II toxin-antitoxin system RelE/ParE family toxin [Defluviitaleaceae bacterium]|nr:type II toxin-antitoxin system RelE/ParE family toxin [Defluviitaleaceae bacterium]